jgi:hypothetical protein
MTTRVTDRIVRVLVVVDGLVILAGTLLGFASHDTLNLAALGRIAATSIPFIGAWYLVSPWLGVYDPPHALEIRGIWRILLACCYAAPLGAVVRAAWLKSSALPLFVLIMAGVLGTMLVVWRSIAVLLYQRSR